MKYVFGIIIIVAIGVIGWYALNTDQAVAPERDTEVTSQSAADVSESDEDAAAGAELELTADAGTADAVVIDMVGTNYAYDVSEIRVQQGDTVTINFAAAEGFHDVVIDEFDAATERITSGQSTSVTFVADEAGTFEYYCSVGNHRAQGMVGTLIVE